MSENILSRYSIEIYTPLGTLIADLTGMASMRALSVARNRVATCSFDIDFYTLQSLAQKMNMTIFDLIAINHNEIRIRRGTRYLAGTQISYFDPQFDEKSNKVNVRGVGFLDLFASRYIDWNGNTDWVYSSTDAGAIAWDLINHSQSQINGNYGITQGTIQTSVNRARTYPAYKNIKEALVELSQVQNGFDFEFAYDKKFNVYYPSQGIDLTNTVLFNYPGNIKKFQPTRDGTQMFNRAIVRGQGQGTQQLIETRDDTVTQAFYYVRESVLSYPDISETATLDAHGDGQIAVFKNPLEIIQLTIDGSKQPFLGSYWIGDRIKIEIDRQLKDYGYIKNHTYKIDAIDVSIDDNDVEDITLTVTQFS